MLFSFVTDILKKCTPVNADFFTLTGFKLSTFVVHYTIIDFNEVDIRIYLPEKVIFTEAVIYVKFYFHFYN